MTETVHHASSRKLLGQYYTECSIGSALVEALGASRVGTAIELGVGNQSLLRHVRRQWPGAVLLSVDIDPLHSRERWESVADRHFCADALDPELSSALGGRPSFADIAVCNPPFVAPRWRAEFPEMLRRVGLPVPRQAIKFNADALFLAQNLWMLRRGGRLGIIVPDGLVSGEKWRSFRRDLMQRNRLVQVIELPARAFKGTEVRTYILILIKGTPTTTVRLSKLTPDGRSELEIAVSADDAENRADHTYYFTRQAVSAGRSGSLDVRRGVVTVSESRARRMSILHTTDLQNAPTIDLSWGMSSAKSFPQAVIARRGDVVMSRVGRGFERKLAYVAKGEAIVSDCVYVLRASGRSGRDLIRAMSSCEGQQWLRAQSRGSCARFITKSKLSEFPY